MASQHQRDADSSTYTKSGYAPSDDSELFAFYLAERAPRDKALKTSWSEKTNGIVIFAALFSTIIATFVVDSYKSLQPDPVDVVVLALSRISQQLAAGTNGSSQPEAFLPNTSMFHAPLIAVRVNVLWSISLVLSISVAIGAVVVQQCTLDYLARQSEQQHNNRHDVRTRALWHAYFLQGVERSFLINIPDYLGAILHLAYFLFLWGLVLFLSDINKTVYNATFAAVIAISGIYALISSIPAVYPSFPYHTPLTPPLSVLYFIFKATILPPAILILLQGASIVGIIVHLTLTFAIAAVSVVLFVFSLVPYGIFHTLLHYDAPSPFRTIISIFKILNGGREITPDIYNSWIAPVVDPAERLLRDKLERSFIGDLSDYLKDDSIVMKTKEMALGSDSSAITLLAIAARRITSHPSRSTSLVQAIESSASILRNASSRLFEPSNPASDSPIKQERIRMAHKYLYSVWLLQEHHLNNREELQAYDNLGNLGVSLIPPAIKHVSLSASEHIYGPQVTILARCTVALAIHSMFMKLHDPRRQEALFGISRRFKEFWAMTLFARTSRADFQWVAVQTISYGDFWWWSHRRPCPLFVHDAAPIRYLSAFISGVLPYLDGAADLEFRCIISTARTIVSDIESTLRSVVIPAAEPSTRFTFQRCLEDLCNLPPPPASGSETSHNPTMDPTSCSILPAAETYWSRLPRTVRRKRLLAELSPVRELLESIDFDGNDARFRGHMSAYDRFLVKMADTGMYGEDGLNIEKKRVRVLWDESSDSHSLIA